MNKPEDHQLPILLPNPYLCSSRTRELAVVRDAAWGGPRYCIGQRLHHTHSQVVSSWPKVQRKLLYYPITNISTIFTPSENQVGDKQSEFMK